MRELKTGDVVLSSPSEAARVIVNQLASVNLVSTVLVIEHEKGVLALTPDHVLLADGAFRSAAEVMEGSVLEPMSKVRKITQATHRVVNPLTTSGTILAAGPTGAPVVASVLPEWSASFLRSSSMYPFPFSAAAVVSYLFPESVQAYYDEQLEAFFALTVRGLEHMKAALPEPFALMVLFSLDVALVVSWALWAMCSAKAVSLALFAVATTAAVRVRGRL